MSGCHDCEVLEGKLVHIACVAGSPLVFGSESPPHFELPRWIPDNDVTFCNSCTAAFTLLRRRHHCRACGNIFCDKCCKSEIPLPQYRYSTCEKVCDKCAPSAALLAKVASSLPYQRLEAAKGLDELAKEACSLPAFLQQGGLQGLVYLAGDINFQTKSMALTGLLTLSTHDQLLGHLANAGCINAVCSTLNGTQLDENIVYNSMIILTAFCRQPTLRQRVVMEGALAAISVMLTYSSRQTQLLALTALCLLTEDQSIHAFIMKNPTALLSVLSLVGSGETQVKHYAFLILANLAATSKENGLLILQNDFLKGQNILKVFQVCSDDANVMRNSVMLVGNMAFYLENQEALRPYIVHIFDLLNNWPNRELLTEVIRTVANFCIKKDNVSLIISRLPPFVSRLLNGEDDAIRYQCLRAVLHLLSHSAPALTASLTSDDCSSVLACLARMPGVLDGMQRTVDTLAPGLGMTLTRAG